MKEMSKAKIVDKRSERSIKSEKDLLSRMRHPFIVNMNYAFQDIDMLYLVLDYHSGGDLRFHISKMNHKKMKFTEEQSSKENISNCLLLIFRVLHCLHFASLRLLPCK